jgi:hypothetical protein
MHRESLLASEVASCYYCFTKFHPSEVSEWCDGTQTAICPYCGIDAVVGFNGNVDQVWLQAMHDEGFK